MGSGSEKKQRLLQLAMAAMLILVVVLVEMVAVSPPGIFSYAQSGFEGFDMGADRSSVLKEINKIKSIRTIFTCEPEGEVSLSSRRRFEMVPSLAEAGIWQCRDRKKGVYLFIFKENVLSRLLYLNDLPGKDHPFGLFDTCPAFRGDQGLDEFLRSQTRYPVYYH